MMVDRLNDAVHLHSIMHAYICHSVTCRLQRKMLLVFLLLLLGSYTTAAEGGVPQSACATEEGGLYWVFSNNQGSCEFCPKGYYCPPNNYTKIACPKGTHQPMMGRSSCMDCDVGYFQNLTGQEWCNPCNTTFTLGKTSLVPGSSSCPACLWDDYYLDIATNTCKNRGPACDPATQYEIYSNTTRKCAWLSACDTKTYLRTSLAVGLPEIQVLCPIIPLHVVTFLKQRRRSGRPTSQSTRQSTLIESAGTSLHALQKTMHSSSLWKMMMDSS